MNAKLYVQDTSGVHNLHGTPGILSAIASAVAAGIATNVAAPSRTDYETRYGKPNKAAIIICFLFTHWFGSLYLVFPARAPTENLTNVELLLGIEPGEGRSAAQQAGFQIALLASTLVLAIIGGLLTGELQFLFKIWQ